MQGEEFGVRGEVLGADKGDGDALGTGDALLRCEVWVVLRWLGSDVE